MESVLCKQEKPLKAKIVSTVLLLLAVFILFIGNEAFLFKIIFFLCSLFAFGYSVIYKIRKDFTNQKYIRIFGLPLIRLKLDIEYPDYISVFATALSLDNEWGAVAAIGTKERHDKFVVRFFTGNRKFTVFQTKDYNKALN